MGVFAFENIGANACTKKLLCCEHKPEVQQTFCVQTLRQSLQITPTEVRVTYFNTFLEQIEDYRCEY